MDKILDREVAWRIFAWEFNRSNLHVSEGDERAPNYIVTPTGVKCNRLFIVGVVTEVENIGKDNNLWRARIADPTGVFTVYAGQYQPEAAIFLSELNVPAYAAVVGKARKYEPDDGSVYTSIRPEEINIADEKLRDRWVVDTAERTLERIKLMDSALSTGKSGNDLKEYLVSRGTSALISDGIMRAIEHYKNLDKIIPELKNVIIHAVEVVRSEGINKVRDAPEAEQSVKKSDEIIEKIEKIEEAVSEAVSPLEPEINEAVKEPKEILADIIDKLDTGRGTSYEAVEKAALSAGVEVTAVETGIKDLMSEGRCYEPKIGVLRKV